MVAYVEIRVPDGWDADAFAVVIHEVAAALRRANESVSSYKLEAFRADSERRMIRISVASEAL